jgi:hypothetical protein
MRLHTHKKHIGRSKKRTLDVHRASPIEFSPRGGADHESLTQNLANGPQSDSGIGILPISVLT